MTTKRYRHVRGFTLIEVLIGMSLSLMIMAGVLSSYVFVGRSFARTFGVSSTGGGTLEAQGRRTLAYFAQDVEMASGFDTSGIAPKVTPGPNGFTLLFPSARGASSVTWIYDVSTQTLTRTVEGGTSQIIHSNLLSLTFNYYDSAGNPYTTFTNYLPGIKQLSLAFSCQAGDSSNGTQTQVYQVVSPRMVLRNRQVLQ